MKSSSTKAGSHSLSPLPLSMEMSAYLVDAFERWTLLLDVVQQRSATYHEHSAQSVPHVLQFGCDLVMDGRTLARPVNYALVRVVPPAGVEIDENKRPFVVVDPRAGHGPGIGGFKADSEIGVVFKAGHPCYFVGFSPNPVPGQTMEDVVEAQATFVAHVASLHPKAEGKPTVIGNCQAGWAVMMAAARRPEAFGPLIIAGSPLAYWAGVRGENPMRYTGGLMGGSWLSALMSDLGKGKFDGAWLVSNFENLNPANTYWTKNYNLYANIDRESARYLDFERWWGSHTLLGAEEMQFIVDELFIGNKLAASEIVFQDGSKVDLRRIRSPIVIFCSKADNITPPGQALGWLPQLYGSVDDIRAHGQTIVYTVHESAGHLGIFVSGAVAKKEHQEFASNVDLIDVLPPGLYEAVISSKQPSHGAAELVGGDYLVQFETRTLDDIRKFEGNVQEDDRLFGAVKRISDTNLGIYRLFLQPWVRLFVNEQFADLTRRLQPLRLRHEVLSLLNPMLPGLPAAAARVQECRHSTPSKNMFWQAQEMWAHHIESSLNLFRDMRDHASEALFHGVYGSPLVQAFAGQIASEKALENRPELDALNSAFVALRKQELRDAIDKGGPREATIRALLYIRMPDGIADERGFRLVQQIREDTGSGLPLPSFKQMVREQFFSLLVDERSAIAAIPTMLARDPDLSVRMAVSLRRVLRTIGVDSSAGKQRLSEIEELFDKGADVRAAKRISAESPTGSVRKERAVPVAAGAGKGHA